MSNDFFIYTLHACMNFVQAWQVLCKDTVSPENIKEHWIKAVEQLLEKRAKRVTKLHAVALLNFISLPRFI